MILNGRCESFFIRNALQQAFEQIEEAVSNGAGVFGLGVVHIGLVPVSKSRFTTAESEVYLQILSQKEGMELPGRIAHQSEVIEKCKLDIDIYRSNAREYDKEERKKLREKIFSALKANVLMQSEQVLMTYQGFSIVLPVNMTMEKPYVWLQANGRYYVELADTELGVLVRIDNYLDKLEILSSLWNVILPQ